MRSRATVRGVRPASAGLGLCLALAPCLALAAAAAVPASAVTPPTVVQQRPATYPPGAPQPVDIVVVLAVTVEADGRVSTVDILNSGVADPAFAAAAIDAVRQWQFAPARQAGRPVAARIRVPITFPATAPPPGPAVAPVPSASPLPAAAPAPTTSAPRPPGAPAPTTGPGSAAAPAPGASSPGPGPTAPAPGASPPAPGSAPVPSTSSPAPGSAPVPATSSPGTGPAVAPVPSTSPRTDAAGLPPSAAPGPAPSAPAPSDSPGPSAPSSPAPSDSPASTDPAAGEPVLDVGVRGRRPPPPRAASDFVLDRDTLTAAPRQSAGDMLSAAPGVYIARPEGEAVAHEIFLRGFDAAHGPDIEFTAGGVPLNQISHLHGQGYADLNFILPEVVRSIRVTEGVYDPRQGDFAVAGSIDFDLAVPRRGFQLRSSGGSFGTFRQLALWAPKGQSDETFAAAAIRRTSGFGRNRGGLSGTAIGQFAFTGPAGLAGKLHVAAHAARAGIAGVLRDDDLRAGRVDFYGTYADPSASAQSASAARGQLALELARETGAGGRTSFLAHFALVDFHSRENFTGFTQRAMVMPAWVGRGDLIEQQNRDVGGGFRLSHRTGWWRPARSFHAALELGTSARVHRLQQAQSLLQAPQNEIWDRRVDATVLATDIGLYADLDLRLGKYVQLRGGARSDVLHYDIDDRLGNFIAPYQVASHLVGHRRTATGVAAGPRATLVVTPRPWLSTFVAYGQGYRSPQARQLEEGERAPFAKVHSVEGGLKLAPRWRRPLHVTAAGFGTFLASDLAFDPEEGRLEKIGPTRRGGMVAAVHARPVAWLLTSASVTYVHAILAAPPPASAENPNPPYQAGQLLPYVPPVVVRADVGVDKDLVQLGRSPLGLRIGAGFSYLSRRPLPYGQFSDPVHLLDASAGLRWSYVELGVEAYNILARRYAATVYSFVSDWNTTPAPSRLPARHFAAGPPTTVLGTLTLSF
jgi:iron complex outermembrane receptor protein